MALPGARATCSKNQGASGVKGAGGMGEAGAPCGERSSDVGQTAGNLPVHLGQPATGARKLPRPDSDTGGRSPHTPLQREYRTEQKVELAVAVAVDEHPFTHPAGLPTVGRR
jgi:hypothetical protein